MKSQVPRTPYDNEKNVKIFSNLSTKIQYTFKKINSTVCLCLSLVTIAYFLPASVSKVSAQEQTVALCQGTRNTIRIYYRERKMMLRAFDRKNKIVWLNAAAKSVSQAEGIEYSNIRGESAVRISVPNQGNSCTIQIGKLAAEKGRLLEQTSVKNQGLENRLLAGEWLLEDLAGRGVMDNIQTTIKFEEDGRLTGSGGCNRYFADYELKGNRIKIGTIGATRKACPPAIMNQESLFFKALAEAYRIRFDEEKGWLFIDCQQSEKPLKFTLITRKN